MVEISLLTLVIMWLTLILSFTIFGISGFGSTLIAAPILAFFLPINTIVPLLALLDLCAAFTNTLKDAKYVDRRELKRLMPTVLIGSALGTLMLFIVKPDILLPILGGFVVCYALYNLRGRGPKTKFAPGLAPLFGIIGGFFGGLFGSGGFVYIIYLSGHIEDKRALRSTQTTIIGFNLILRILLFLIAGVYFDLYFLKMVALLFPAMVLGGLLGRRITLKLSRETFLTVVNSIVLCSGLSLLIKYFLVA